MGIRLIFALVIPGIIYLVLISWGISRLLHTLCTRKREVPQRVYREKNDKTQAYPILQTFGLYIGPIWITGLLAVSASIVAVHWLHALEMSEYVARFIFLILPYSLVLIVMLQKLTIMFAARRQEPSLNTNLSMKIYVIGIIVSIIIFFTFQEHNPLEKYGVDFEWYDPADEPGKYHFVHLIRHLHGQTISGPLCGGQYPKVTFSDEDRDGIEDILVHTKQGKEIGVFGIIEPYVTGSPAFKVIRGSDETCPTPSSPPFADYLKVQIF